MAAERSAEEAKARALASEAAEVEAEKKYKQALALKEGKFEELIAELFENPSRELKERIEESAGHNNKLTLKTTMYSILFTAAVAVATLVVSSLQGREIHDRLRQATDPIKKIASDIPGLDGKVHNVESRLDALGSKLAEVESSVSEISKAQARLQVDTTIYYMPRPSYLDVSACIAQGEKVLKEYGASSIQPQPGVGVTGASGVSRVLISCLAQYKVTLVIAFGQDYKNNTKVVADLNNLLNKG